MIKNEFIFLAVRLKKHSFRSFVAEYSLIIPFLPNNMEYRTVS